ncbi:hexokinase-1-like isoform X2 [Homarus americanus]|uniref:Phosphotransferase n=2 Tax=Homarus americanus TaxID=6706 RepID=A0A8J5TLT2_HOMAM|nr:hexokinase-1-like isoform X2 [Homarus americanus]XP_042211221.1 hexokinase-1-like isoform X2 [Homarus americanus]KAG7175053.1 Hexokinase-1-like [Homarus americanus]
MVATSPLELPTLTVSDPVRRKKILERLSPLILTPGQQQKIHDIFLDEMRLGLAAKPEKESSLLMANTFIPELPDGTENGEYLALDLGGTHFRVIYAHMKNGKFDEEIVDYYHVPSEKRLGPGEELFDFLAECIANFIQKRQLGGRNFQLGFTFSFPMIQKSLDVGILVSWTKSFNCPGVVGEDAVRMLNDAIKRQGGLDITVTAILNDTTGTLVMGAYLDKRCAMGMILGTGCNGCYIEKVERIEKWLGKHKESEVIIDIEWGSFGDNGVLDFIRTQWDDAVDNQSLLVHSYTFEKYFAGKYLGDLFREVLLTLAKEGLFCSGGIDILNTHGAITATNVSNIESDSFKGVTDETKAVFDNLNLIYDDDDLHIALYVAGILSYRGVLLVSLLSGILLERMKHDHCTIAIDGSLFQHHPRFRPLMEKFISDTAPGRSFDLRLAHDGSGKGAALTASIAERLKKRSSR